VLVRQDIPLSQQLVQAVHAAHEAGIYLSEESQTSSVVVCGVSNEQELLKSQARIESRGIRFVLFREPDMNDEATALASEPLNGTGKKAFANYKLWRP
jgi:hypothetical protein